MTTGKPSGMVRSERSRQDCRRNLRTSMTAIRLQLEDVSSFASIIVNNDNRSYGDDSVSIKSRKGRARKRRSGKRRLSRLAGRARMTGLTRWTERRKSRSRSPKRLITFVSRSLKLSDLAIARTGLNTSSRSFRHRDIPHPVPPGSLRRTTRGQHNPKGD